MKRIKICPVCGGKFVADKSTTTYCSRVCCNADRCKKVRKTNIDVGYQELVAPPRGEFDLEPGDLITGPDKQLDGDKNKRHEFRVTKVYRHFFEAVRTDRGWERSFPKADYITGIVRRVKGEKNDKERNT